MRCLYNFLADNTLHCALWYNGPMNFLSWPDYPSAFWMVAPLALIILGVDKAGFGGGVGVVAAPLIALTIPVPDVAGLLLPILLFADALSVRHYYRFYDATSLRVLLPGGVIGIGLGALVFTYLSHHVRLLRVGVGVMALLFVLFQISRARWAGVWQSQRPATILGAVLGGLAGFGSTVIHAGGPFALFYLLPQQLPREQFVGSMVLFFAALNLLKLIPYTYLGLVRTGDLLTILLLLPLTFASVRLGIYLNQRFDNTWFTQAIYGLLLVTGLQLILG
jgi:uncharacterized protein